MPLMMTDWKGIRRRRNYSPHNHLIFLKVPRWPKNSPQPMASLQDGMSLSAAYSPAPLHLFPGPLPPPIQRLSRSCSISHTHFLPCVWVLLSIQGNLSPSPSSHLAYCYSLLLTIFWRSPPNRRGKREVSSCLIIYCLVSIERTVEGEWYLHDWERQLANLQQVPFRGSCQWSGGLTYAHWKINDLRRLKPHFPIENYCFH